MQMTPIVRYKNINVENLMSFLDIYPDLGNSVLWERAFQELNLDAINTEIGGYKTTAYQFACQLALEDRGSDYYKLQEYLFAMNEEFLAKYLMFWIVTYYAPNPYVNSDSEPQLIWLGVAKAILSSPEYKIDFNQYFHDNINDSIDVINPSNAGNLDTLFNVINLYGHPLKGEKQGKIRFLSINSSDRNMLEELINIVETKFPVPTDYRNKSKFFDRYSFENFCSFFGLEKSSKKEFKDALIYQNVETETNEYSNNKVNFDINFVIKDLYFDNKDVLERQISKALKSGKHIILTGPPGTGKSKLAKQISEHYNVKYRMTTAISDWSTYETVGGYKLNKDGQLYFDEGIFLSCFKDSDNEFKNEWLIIDEMNRADIDKAFGVFFSTLAGDSVNLSFKDEQNRSIEILNEASNLGTSNIEGNQYIISNDWRLIGTINTYDKTSLFEMSYAFMRRFAFIHLSVPKNINEEMIVSYLDNWAISNKLVGLNSLASGLKDLWIIINKYRVIGPAILKDIAAYVEEEEDWISAITLYVLPQFEGIDGEKINQFVEELLLSNIEKLKDGKDLINKFIEDFFGTSL